MVFVGFRDFRVMLTHNVNEVSVKVFIHYFWALMFDYQPYSGLLDELLRDYYTFWTNNLDFNQLPL